MDKEVEGQRVSLNEEVERAECLLACAKALHSLVDDFGVGAIGSMWAVIGKTIEGDLGKNGRIH